MSESRIGGRLDTETFELYEKLRDETGFTGQRKDTRFIKVLLTLLQDLQKRDMLAVSNGPSPMLVLRSEITLESMNRNTPTLEHDQKENAPTGLGSAENALAFLQSSQRYNEPEYEEMMQACERSYGSLDEFLWVGGLSEARKVNMLAEKTTQFDFRDATQRGRRRGAGFAYVESVVQQLIEANLAAKDPWEKVYITRGQVAKLTGTNRADINAYFDNHRDMLEQHHTSVGFTTVEAGESHNRLRIRQMKEKSAEE